MNRRYQFGRVGARKGGNWGRCREGHALGFLKETVGFWWGSESEAHTQRLWGNCVRLRRLSNKKNGEKGS